MSLGVMGLGVIGLNTMGWHHWSNQRGVHSTQDQEKTGSNSDDTIHIAKYWAAPPYAWPSATLAPST